MSREAIVGLERMQHGLITWKQLREIGLTEDAIRHLVSRGRVERLHRGVYANPSVARTFTQSIHAAVLAAGNTAFASHSTAARLWGVEAFASSVVLEATTVLERQPRVRGVRMHRSGLLHESDIRCVDNIPVASAARTIVDLSGRLEVGQLGRLVDDIVRLRLATLSEIASLAGRLPRAPGRSPYRLRSVLDGRTGVGESRLEDFVFAAVARYGLPLPVRQHPVLVSGRNRRIDLCYPACMLALEAQGFEFHGTRSRFDADALRGNELQLAGFRVLEFTSAFDDWTIARQVALALGRPVPQRQLPVLTFNAWRLAS